MKSEKVGGVMKSEKVGGAVPMGGVGVGGGGSTAANEIVVYQPNETMRLEVALRDETVWLNQMQMSELFGRERSVIAKHIHNAFKEGELDADSVCAKFAQTAGDGKNYQVDFYNR